MFGRTCSTLFATHAASYLAGRKLPGKTNGSITDASMFVSLPIISAAFLANDLTGMGAGFLIISHAAAFELGCNRSFKDIEQQTETPKPRP